MLRKLAITAVFLVFASPMAMALGLGDIDMQSALNQPMQAVIKLTSSAGTRLSDIKVSLASLEAHQRAGLTKAQVLTSFHFNVEKDTAGNAVVHVTSSDPIREPYLEFLLELDWPKGRLLRQYTVLVDPPVTMPAAAPVTSPAQSRPAVATPARSQPETIRPARVVPASVATPAAAAGTYGPVRRTDTLWTIAQHVRPDRSVSVYQVMQALLRANPDAFIDHNVNRMKAGVTLNLPDMDEIRAMSSREAFAESKRQYEQWQSENATGTGAATAATGTSEPPGTTGGDTTESGSQSPAEPRLSLVAPEEGEGVDGAAVPGDSTQAGAASGNRDSVKQQLALATEEAEASRAQSAELQSRVDDLEQQVETMKRLLELKNHALAELQHQSEQGTAVAETPAPDTQAAATPADATPRVSPAPVTPDTTATATATAIIGKVLGNPLLAGGIVLAALLLGGFLWAANRQRSLADIDDDLSLESRLAGKDDTLFRPAPEFTVHDEPRTQRTEPVHAAAHDSDPLTEVDVYLAYGRVQQAEDLLRAAIQDDPDSDALRMKLLEVYHSAGNATAFEQAASDFRDGVAENDGRWIKVAGMGYTLDPHNELYRAAWPDVEPVAEEMHDAAVQQDVADSQDSQYGEDTLPDTMEFIPDDYHIEIEDEMEGVLATEDEITTKLDLARAYIDMDDKDSARNILDEVIEEGNTDQKQEAERIIAKLA